MQTPKTFLSYSRSDSAFAARLLADLRSHGHAVWQDKTNIEGGLHWDSAIENALAAAETVLVVLSPKSAASNNVKDEYFYAIDKGKRVIPVMYVPCEIPLRLRRVQYVDFTADYNAGLQNLLALMGEGTATESNAVDGKAARRPEIRTGASAGQSVTDESSTAVPFFKNKAVLAVLAVLVLLGAYFLFKPKAAETESAAQEEPLEPTAADSAALGKKLQSEDMTLYYTDSTSFEYARHTLDYLRSLNMDNGDEPAPLPTGAVFQLDADTDSFYLRYAVQNPDSVPESFKSSMKDFGKLLADSVFTGWPLKISAGNLLEKAEYYSRQFAKSVPETTVPAQ